LRVSSFQFRVSVLVGFVLTGVVTTLLGPILPVLSSKWSLSDAHAGYLFTAQFLGSSSGTLLSGFFIARLGFDRLLTLGFGVMAIGVAALGLAPWPMCIGAVAAYGVALGLTIPATNVFVAENNPERAAAALSILNAAWSVGAVVCPPLVALLIVKDDRMGRLLGLAAMLAVVALFLEIRNSKLETRNLKLGARESKMEPPVFPPSSIDSRQSKIERVILFAALFFLYVGIENSVGGWVATYAHRLSSEPGTRWELAPSLFWATLLFGRALAPTVLRYVMDAKLVVASLLMTCLGVTALLISKTPVGVFVAVSLAGLGLSSVFPITIAMLTRCSGSTASQVAGPMFALGGLGGAALPWLVGFLSSQFGSLRVGLVVPLLAALIMIALQLSNRASLSPTAPSERAPAILGPE